MQLFGKKQEKERNSKETQEVTKESGNKDIEPTGSFVKILGTGCAKCDKLTDNTREALNRLGRNDAHIEHVTNIKDIVSYGVMITPALVINGKVKSVGKVLSPEEAYELLQEHL